MWSEPDDLVMWTRWTPGKLCEPGWSPRGGRRSASRPEHGLCSQFLFRNNLNQHFSDKSKDILLLFATTLCPKYFLYLLFAWHSPTTTLLKEFWKFLRTLRENVRKGAVADPPASLSFNKSQMKCFKKSDDKKIRDWSKTTCMIIIHSQRSSPRS